MPSEGTDVIALGPGTMVLGRPRMSSSNHLFAVAAESCADRADHPYQPSDYRWDDVTEAVVDLVRSVPLRASFVRPNEALVA